MKELQQRGDDITFHLTNSTIEAPPPIEFQTFFGNPPHWRFVYIDGTSMNVLARHRDFVEEETPEKSIRSGQMPTGKKTIESVEYAIRSLRKTMVESGPFHGVIGYSEGAAIGSTLLIEELRQAKKTGVPSTLKCGIFIAGAPAFRTEVGGWNLWDEVGEVIDVPTCHVLGVSDPYLHCALALHDICDSEKAVIFRSWVGTHGPS